MLSGGLRRINCWRASPSEDKWSKHSMLLCQVPSCLVSGPSWSLCSASVCVRVSVRAAPYVCVYNIRVNVVEIERCRVNVFVRVGVCLLNISLQGDLRCVSSVTSCHLQWLPPTEKATWSLRVCARVCVYIFVYCVAMSTTETWKYTAVYKHLSVSI